MTDTADQFADEWPAVRDQMLTNPRVRAAYIDCGNESDTCRALMAARVAASMTAADVARFLADYTGMSRRKALRWVHRYESGELGGNTPVWLIHAYARAVGVQATIVVAEAA